MNIDKGNMHFVYVESLNRVAGTSSNFTFNLNMPTDRKFNKVVLLNAMIPKSYYLFSSSNNTFQLQEGSTTVTITIPVGDYSLTSFRTAIGALLTANSPNLWTYTLTYPNTLSASDTGKITYNVSGNSSQPSLIFLSSGSVWEAFGFNQGSTNVFSSNTLTCTNVIKLQVEDRLYINSNMIAGSPNNIGVLQEINVAPSPSYSSIVYQCTAPEFYAKYIVSANSSAASFWITDEHGSQVDLNGLNCSFTLLFFYENDIFSRLKSFLQLITVKLGLN